MEFSILFFISFSIIPDVQFDFLSTGVHLANIFRKQFAMTSMSLDNQDAFYLTFQCPCPFLWIPHQNHSSNKNINKQLLSTQDLCFCIHLKFFIGFHSSVEGQPKGNLLYLSNSAPSGIFSNQCPTPVVGLLLSAVLNFLSLMNMMSVRSTQSSLPVHTLSLCPSYIQKVRRFRSAVCWLINSLHSRHCTLSMWSILKWDFGWQACGLYSCFQLKFPVT